MCVLGNMRTVMTYPVDPTASGVLSACNAEGVCRRVIHSHGHIPNDPVMWNQHHATFSHQPTMKDHHALGQTFPDRGTQAPGMR